MNDSNNQYINALPIGTVLHNGERDYKIKSVLGQGGFGITYLASAIVRVGNVSVEANFAIKEHFDSSLNMRQGREVITSNPTKMLEIQESINSFMSEARRLNELSLSHPNIVNVNESFKENGTAYYVMEYVEGQSLREFVKKAPQGRLTELNALRLFYPIAATIGYLHQNCLTHLDIKPDNIILHKDGQPVIIDFGLSKHYSCKGTPTSTVKAAGCSEGYSPIEQYAGIITFTPEADIYALAATLLFMLTGKDPINSVEINEEIIRSCIPQGISESTISMILKAMEKLKENRTSSVSDIMNGLNTESSLETTEENKDISQKSTRIIRHFKKRNYWKKGGFCLLIFFVVLLSVVMLKQLSIPHDTKMISKSDSLSYVLGMVKGAELKDTLCDKLRVDSSQIKEFTDGLKYGLGIGEYPKYYGKQIKAFNVGKRIANQIEEEIIPSVNRKVFVNYSNRTISSTLFLNGYIDAIEKSCSKMDNNTSSQIASEMMILMRNAINNEIAMQYLAKNKAEMHSLSNGMLYRVISPKVSDAPPSDTFAVLGDIMRVRYYREGILIDGTIFEMADKGRKVIEDYYYECKFQELFEKMSLHDICEVYIPTEIVNKTFVSSVEEWSSSPLIFKIEIVDYEYFDSDAVN